MSDINRAVATTENCLRLEISDLRSRRILLYYLCCENKGPDQLRGDLRLRFRICRKQISQEAAHIVRRLVTCRMKMKE